MRKKCLVSITKLCPHTRINSSKYVCIVGIWISHTILLVKILLVKILWIKTLWIIIRLEILWEILIKITKIKRVLLILKMGIPIVQVQGNLRKILEIIFMDSKRMKMEAKWSINLMVMSRASWKRTVVAHQVVEIGFRFIKINKHKISTK